MDPPTVGVADPQERHAVGDADDAVGPGGVVAVRGAVVLADVRMIPPGTAS